MDKSEKINKIKALQESISNNVKEKKFSFALEDVNELLTLAPNLEKIQELKIKLEAQLAKKPEPKPETEKPVPSKPEEKQNKEEPVPLAEEKKELKIEAAGKPVEKKPASPTPETQTGKEKLSSHEEERLLEELMQDGEMDEPEKAGGKAEAINGSNGITPENDQVLFEEELSFNVGKDDVLTPEAVEAKLQQLLLQEKEQYKDGTPAEKEEDIFSATDKELETDKELGKGEQTDLDDLDLETLITKDEDEPLPIIKAQVDEETRIVTPITESQVNL